MKNRNTDGWRKISVLWRMSLTVSCVRCPCWGRALSHEKKKLWNVARLVLSGGWSQSDGGVGRSVTAAVLRLSPVLSHGLTMLGELVGGGGLRWMGTRGQGAGNGYSPGHQPLHRSGYPAGGNTHQARRESGEGQEVLSRCKSKLKELRWKCCYLPISRLVQRATSSTISQYWAESNICV